jgi:hypothetical protein
MQNANFDARRLFKGLSNGAFGFSVYTYIITSSIPYGKLDKMFIKTALAFNQNSQVSDR